MDSKLAPQTEVKEAKVENEIPESDPKPQDGRPASYSMMDPKMRRIYGEFYHARGPAAELRNQMLAPRTPEQSYDGIAWLYGGP